MSKYAPSKQNKFASWNSLQLLIAEFTDIFQKIVNQHNGQISCIMNTNESGLNYEIASERKLDINTGCSLLSSLLVLEQKK